MTDFMEQSERLRRLPPYVFAEINALRAEAQRRGVHLVSLAIGDPDLPTPEPIVDKICEAARNAANHGYSPYEGTAEFRSAVSRYFARRFSVKLDPAREIVALIGSKEGIAHFPLAFCNRNDRCLYPSPGYPIFSTALALADADARPIPLRAENGFLPDLEELERMFRESRPKYLLLNFPSNPCSVQAPREMLEKLVGLAKRHEVIVGFDNAYAEIYFDEAARPPSILEIPGAKDVAIEFHSFSKTFSMTGWRIAFACGNEKLVQGLLRAKTNIDSGPLLAVQEAAAFAADNAETLIPPVREVYRRRRRLALEKLQALGVEVVPSNATFFLWCRVPGGRKSMPFAKALIEKQGLVVMPGSGFGDEGEHFFRLSLTVPDPVLEDALARLGQYLASADFEYS